MISNVDGEISFQTNAGGAANTTHGNVLAGTDGTYDIGLIAVSRFRDLNLQRNATIGGTLVVTNSSATNTITATLSSGWALIVTNNGGAGANGVYINVGPSATGTLFRVDKNGAEQFSVSNAGTTQATSSTADYVIKAVNNHGANPFGLQITYGAAAPNGTTNDFLVCSDTVGTRATIRSNGGLANFSANNVNISDERTKFMGDSLDGETLTAAFRKLNPRKFKYIDQAHSDDNLGFGAHELYDALKGTGYEDSIVDRDGWERGDEMMWAIYESDLAHATIAVVKHGINRTDALDKRLRTLERRVAA
jgi:hypothetical protein